MLEIVQTMRISMRMQYRMKNSSEIWGIDGLPTDTSVNYIKCVV